MTPQKRRELYLSWLALVKLKVSMGEKVLELIAHPESKPEHVAEVMPRYKAVVEMLRKHKPAMLNALRHDPALYTHVSNTKI